MSDERDFIDSPVQSSGDGAFVVEVGNRRIKTSSLTDARRIARLPSLVRRYGTVPSCTSSEAAEIRGELSFYKEFGIDDRILAIRRLTATLNRSSQ